MIAYDPILQPLLLQNGYHVDVLRLDKIHPEISGNKWFKLKYNLEKAIGNLDTIVTFGGAFSNHIAATAAACKLFNLKSVAVIRGEEPETLNPTLEKAKQDGMQLHFISREMYAQKNRNEFKKQLEQQFGPHYLIPEGGNNENGVLGCMEILKPEWDYDLVFCACGTATTYAGLVASAKPNQKIIGISVLKGENKLPAESSELLKNIFPDKKTNVSDSLQFNEHCITNAYSFSGYAKYDQALIDFKNAFELQHNIPLDHVYTTKLFYAAVDLMASKKIKENSRILIVHSGGLQGNRGFEERYHLMLCL